MYLKSLEIQGFKSFPDRTVMKFDGDITAIVGPNGSGKSNIADAVRWVMGEQSTRALRGSKMEDVIFGGTSQRRQTNYAEVSLVIDNTGHIFPMEESEVMVTRRYFRSGESEYFINRRSVRLKDVNELFMDTGLGREGYSIIGQGRIDEILSVRSADRREVFEEAAGISRYRHRKEEAERKLERTDENLVRISDKIAELELQVAPLREQSEKAKQFLQYRDEVKSLEISVWLDTLEKLRAGAIRLETDLAEAQRQLDAVKSAQEKAFSEAETVTAQMQEKDVEADRLRRESAEEQERISALESEVAVLRTSIQHNTESAQRIQADLEQQEGREGSLTSQIAQRKMRLSVIDRDIADRNRELKEKDREAEEVTLSAGTLARELESLRAREELEKADVQDAKALLSALAAAAQEILDRDGALRRECQELSDRLAQARDDRDRAQKEYDRSVSERDAARNVISGYELRLKNRRGKADAAGDTEMKLQVEASTLAGRLKMLNDMENSMEGYQKAVRMVMGEVQRGYLRGVRGPVASLLKVPDQYAVAIETALGGAMQNLVVDREEDGRDVIQFLKRREGGRVTMLPLTAVRPGTLREADQVSREPGFVGIASGLVSCAPEYMNVFISLLGRVVVMENLDFAIAAARKYHYAFRIVTLDGQVLNTSGSMTGGSVSRSAGILTRTNERERVEAQLRGVENQLAEAGRARADAEREAASADYDLNTARDQLRECEDAVLRAEGRLHYCQSVTDDLEVRESGRRRELEQLQQRSDGIEADTREVREKITRLEGSAAALRSEAEGKVQGQTDLQARTAGIASEAAAIRSGIAALEAEREATRTGLLELENLKASIAGDRASSRALMSEYESKNAGFEKEIREKEAALSGLRSRNTERETALVRLRDERLELEGRRNRASKESQTRNEELLACQGEVSRLEQKKNASAMEEKQLLDRLWDTYELSHEAARKQRVEIESQVKANRRIAELKKAMSDLGSVNVGAIEEFERVNERYTYLTDQRSDVEKAKQELETVIGDITKEMRTIFAREFNVINETFQKTFVELFGGGRASLELEDPEDILNCGIEIRCQPPGKALKVISLLSGGEKAFVAIAIYFAILKVRPTPFVIMDEIEAALDDTNVVKYARYMRGMTDRTQFIVITHRRGTMEEADILYGVTMQESGISRMLTISLNDVDRHLNPEGG